MDEQVDKRDQRGSISGQSSIQPEEKGSGNFIRNGFEIFTFNSKTVISWSVLSVLVGLVFGTISVYQSFGSNVDQRITNNRELNRKLDNYEFNIQNLKDAKEDHERRIKDLEWLSNARKK